MTVRVNIERLSRELEELAAFSETASPAVTRVVYSEPDRAARRWLKTRFAAAGLAVREDAVGNTFARWHGSEPGLPAVGTGSHIDAIPNAGRYDGTVGVLGGLEAIRGLQESGFKPRRSIELLLFTSEEPTRFGIGCLGSRLLSGTLSPEAAALLRDAKGESLDTLRAGAGFGGTLESVKLQSGYYSGFAELHIEQGPILERDRVALGVVRSIAAPASLRLSIEGEGGHAGAVLMRQRRDAFVAAAALVLEVEQAALATGSEDTVATVGVCKVFPGAVNSIPSSVMLEIDVRDIDEARRNRVLESIQAACGELSAKRGVTINTRLLNADAPAQCDAAMVELISKSCRELELSCRVMVSRAYHDSLFMSRIAPVAMLFIPCRNGVSHRPDEYASPQDIENGTKVLAETLAVLAR